MSTGDDSEPRWVVEQEEASAHARPERPADPAFRFVEALAGELSAGRVVLPSFPDIAVRVRRAVNDENITHERLARIVGSEAGLAARILSLANSAAYSHGGPELTDLKRAIARIGLLSVRNAALAFSIVQLRSANDLRGLRMDLEALWKQSALTATLAHVIAGHTAFISADDALLAGLLHNIGKVYMLARAAAHRELLRGTDVRDTLEHDWHSSIGQAIAENWGLPVSVSLAIGEQDALDRIHDSRPDLTDVLIVAVAAARYYGKEATTALKMRGTPPFDRLKINEDNWPDILRDGSAEIASLKSALIG